MIKNKVIDFIKVKKIDDYLKKSLETETIFIPKLSSLNDPLEEMSLAGIHSLNSNNIDDEYRKGCGIFSVTRFGNKHFSSRLLPMWAYYGDDHKGVCLVFQPKQINNRPWTKVTYVDLGYEVHWDGKNQFELSKEILSLKLKPWSHEEEYRLIFPPDESGYAHPWKEFCELKQIIFGYKCTPNEINKVVSYLSSNLLERSQLDIQAPDFLDLRQVREPFSVKSDLAPFRVKLEKKTSFEVSGHSDTYASNNNKFYPLGSLYNGQVPVVLVPKH